MATIKLQGNASGSGSVTLTAPNTNSARTVTLPDEDIDLGNLGGAGGVKAWVNFNGSGTVAIRASGNVSSITDNSTGRYTVNFTNSLSSTTYAATTGFGTTLNYGVNDMVGNTGFTPAFFSSSCRFLVNSGANYYDGNFCMLSAVES
tara:strand:+ start:602 stop:1042 length:441 start_codon:yes stop_codon:yes gene_type:complete